MNVPPCFIFKSNQTILHQKLHNFDDKNHTDGSGREFSFNLLEKWGESTYQKEKRGESKHSQNPDDRNHSYELCLVSLMA